MKFSQFIARWIWHTTALKYLSYHSIWPHKCRSSQGHTWKKMTWPVLLIWSSQKFEFMAIFMFSRAENPFLTLLLSYHAWKTSKFQINFRYVQEVLEGTDDCVLWIFEIFPLFMFSRVKNLFLIFLLSYHVSVTSTIQTNFRYKRYLQVLMIVSYEFLKFFHYLCFRGWRIHFWYSYWATMFWWPRKSRSTSGTGGTWRYCWFCLIDFWNFLTIYVFEVGKSISDIATELLCSGVPENPGQLPVQEVLMILSYEFLKFLQYLCFRGQGIYCWHSHWATVFGWSWKSRSTSGTWGTDDSVLWIFEISPVFMFSRSKNPLLAFILSYLVWVTSKTSKTESWPRFLKSPKRGSSVGISAIDSLTLET